MNKKAIRNMIDAEALRELCVRYDLEYGAYPEIPYEGRTLYNFFVNDVERVAHEIDFESWDTLRWELYKKMVIDWVKKK